jgi:hypothetical protein
MNDEAAIDGAGRAQRKRKGGAESCNPLTTEARKKAGKVK